MASLKFNDTYIKDFFTVSGPMEENSRLKKIDIKMDDYYFGEKTFEDAEVKMQKVVCDSLLNKNNLTIKDINLLVGGDLLNQITATNYAVLNKDVSFLGVYSACATFCESLIVGSMFLQNSSIKNILGVTSSHNLTAERQFRYPIEYGCPKPHTSTFTTTGSVGVLLNKGSGKLKIESVTIGKVFDKGIKDANNLGAVMAPSAALTLYEHLKDLKRNADYYDLILTGDLGCIGGKIFEKYFEKEYDIKLKNHTDAGCELYLKSQDTYSGGSGPACLPLVLFNKILSSKKYKKILIIATGALHSTTFVNQKKTIPGISHAVSLEVM